MDSAPSSQRSFLLLLAGQFLAAFGDNAILAVILGQLLFEQNAGAISETDLRLLGAVYTALLFVPYVLLAPLAGFANDRFSKSRCLAAGNALRVLGAAVCWAGHGGAWTMGIGYFLVGVGSCLYGPAKYGVLPEILERDFLVKANGIVELFTLLAILTGAIGGSVLSDVLQGAPGIAFAILGAVFGLAWVCATAMPRTPSDPSVSLGASFRVFGSYLGELARQRRLSRILIGSALFWWCAAALKMNFQPWGLTALGLKSNTDVSLLGLWLSVGVMLGSIVAGLLHKVGDLSWARRYACLLAISLVGLSFVEKGESLLVRSYQFGPITIIPLAALALMATGAAAGLYLIPLNAALQSESDPTKLGKTIAVQNLADNLGMCVAFVVVFAGTKAGLTAGGVFVLLAVGIVLALLALKPLSQNLKKA